MPGNGRRRGGGAVRSGRRSRQVQHHAHHRADGLSQRRGGADYRFLLSNGRGAYFADAQPLAAQDYLVAAYLGDGREARIFLAAAVDRQQLLDYQGALLSEHCCVDWNVAEQCVQARRQRRLGELVLEDQLWQEADPERVRGVLLAGIVRHGSACLPWNDAARQLQARVGFMHRLAPQDWPDLGDDALMTALHDWLSPWLDGMTRLAHLKRLDLHAVLQAQLSWQQQRRLADGAGGGSVGLTISRRVAPPGSAVGVPGLA